MVRAKRRDQQFVRGKNGKGRLKNMKARKSRFFHTNEALSLHCFSHQNTGEVSTVEISVLR
jgi:hypothetical protein